MVLAVPVAVVQYGLRGMRHHPASADVHRHIADVLAYPVTEGQRLLPRGGQAGRQALRQFTDLRSDLDRGPGLVGLGEVLEAGERRNRQVVAVVQVRHCTCLDPRPRRRYIVPAIHRAPFPAGG
ncbi:hypothetical protein D3C79_754790 [compost metagenome]